MSCIALKKPLHPAKKAWNRFATTIQSKLHKLRRSKPIAAILPGRARPPYHPRRRNGRTGFHTRKLSHRRSFAPVYVDELFGKAEVAHVVPPPESGREKLATEKTSKLDEMIGAPASSFTCGSSSTSELGEVDLRAEMFIARFKEEMRLQRQRSFGEYQEMLARGL